MQTQVQDNQSQKHLSSTSEAAIEERWNIFHNVPVTEYPY